MATPGPAMLMPDKDNLDAGLGPLADGEVSLRSWLRQLHEADQLRQIQCQVDSDLELGAITRVNLGLSGPALLFENIRDYQDTLSTRFVTCGMGNKRQLCALLELAPETTDKEIVRHLKQTYANPLEPVIVADSPVKQNILTGNTIDLNQFRRLSGRNWTGGDTWTPFAES